ncbi:MAG: YaaA family protein [Candidatus Saccharimonadales bacterium]
MLTILLHSSKTMQRRKSDDNTYQAPQLLENAVELANFVSTLSADQLMKPMQLSSPMATTTQTMMRSWNTNPHEQLPAIDAFLGDIYSGLQSQLFTDNDRRYANDHLYILSGLYGVLRALDSIMPYRLEMGYRLSDERYKNLYTYWGDSIAKILPSDVPIINLSAAEYTKVVLPHLKGADIISPRFLTIDPKTNEPKFVVVHAKVARGAFASWLIRNRIESTKNLWHFNELGYAFSTEMSTPEIPVFICKVYGGLGLSVRLT